MSFNFNGNTPKEIFFNNQEVKKLIYNGNVVWKKIRLPRLYTEVEYIESTGTQYIDIGVTGTQNTKVDIDFQSTATTYGRFTPFGARSTASKNCFAIWASSVTIGSNLRIGFDSTNGYTGGPTTTDKYHIIHSKDGTYVNDELVWTIDSFSTFTTPQNLLVFGYYSNATTMASSAIRLYHLKLWENNIMVRDFIPCYRNSDGEIGLYDSINDIFYTNQGTGVFIKGKDVYTLPNEYQEVEYIESTGTQYIRTDIVPTDFFKMELKFYTKGASSFYCAGARDSSSSVIYFAQSGASGGRKLSASVNNTSIIVNTNGENWTRPTTGATYEIRLSTNGDGTFSYNLKNLTENQEFLSENNTYPIMGTVTNKVFLFALNSSNKISGTNRCYYFKLYKENELIFYGIPCYRKLDNEAGLYDIVTNTFLTNQGTGEFNVGEDVN